MMVKNSLDNLVEELFAGISYDQYSYTTHIRFVQLIAELDGGLYFLKDSLSIKIALALHDALEDLDITKEELKDRIKQCDRNGCLVYEYIVDRALEIIDAVTDGSGGSRKERKKRSYELTKQDVSAIYVKLCDRLANMQWSYVTKNKSKFNMYKKEYVEFRNQLTEVHDWTELALCSLWNNLEQLANLDLCE